jgi:hypothetical protein
MTAATVTPAARPVDEIFTAALEADCGYTRCSANPGGECSNAQGGIHVGRLATARAAGLISNPEFTRAVIAAAPAVFTQATVLHYEAVTL